MTINNAARHYSLAADQIVDLIANVSMKTKGNTPRPVMVEGPMGSGKTTLSKLLAKKFPNHVVCYFDCTTKDLGDLFLPNIQTIGEGDAVSFVPNEELGVHLGKPVILMFDEWGKGNPALQQGTLRTMLEYTVGTRELPEGSMVFGTTNLSAENVGDTIKPHARNRMVFVRMRHPNNTEWMEWAINNNIDPTLIAWAKDNPQLFNTFEDHMSDPEDNPYIYHPKAERKSFVTPRSLHAASDIIKMRDFLDTHTVRSALMGTIGERAAADLMAFVDLADQIPSAEQIKNNPESAPVPTNAVATMMVVYRTLSTITSDFVTPWMTYLSRLEVEVQALFANMVIKNDKYDMERKKVIASNKKFGEWARANSHLYMSDQ